MVRMYSNGISPFTVFRRWEMPLYWQTRSKICSEAYRSDLCRKHGVDFVRQGLDEVAQKLDGLPLACFLTQSDKGKFRCPVDSYKQARLSFGTSHLGAVYVEIADRIALEGAPGFFAFSLWKATDAVAPRAAVHRRAGWFRDARLEGKLPTIQRQRGVAANRDDRGHLVRWCAPSNAPASAPSGHLRPYRARATWQRFLR